MNMSSIAAAATTHYERGGQVYTVRPPVDLDEKTLARWLKRGIYRISEVGEVERQCQHCKEYFPPDSEFFYMNKTAPDGLHRWCKACYIECRWPNGRKVPAGTASAENEALGSGCAKQTKVVSRASAPQRLVVISTPTPPVERPRDDDGDLSVLEEVILDHVAAATGAVTANWIYGQSGSAYESRLEAARALARLVRLRRLDVVELGGVRRYSIPTHRFDAVEPTPDAAVAARAVAS